MNEGVYIHHVITTMHIIADLVEKCFTWRISVCISAHHYSISYNSSYSFRPMKSIILDLKKKSIKSAKLENGSKLHV